MGSAIYLWHAQAFNYGGNGLACWINNSPLDCGVDIPCTRGPDNIAMVRLAFSGLPLFFVLVFPLVVMVTLYITVRHQQDAIRLQAKSVVSQAALYLLALYWTYIFAPIHYEVTDGKNFFVAVLSAVNLNLLGCWMLMIYWHFRHFPKQQAGLCKNTLCDPTMTQSSDPSSSMRRCRAADFNIFDGTNPTTEFAHHVFEGDDEDKAHDKAQSEMWQDIQPHV